MAYSPSALVELIARNRDKSLAVSKIVGNNPTQLAVVPKLILDKNITDIREEKLNLNRNLLEQLHNRVESNRTNNRNIIKLFPDIELAIQILVSYILSPKKMTDTKLNYKFKKEFGISPGLTAAMLEIVRTHIEEHYELEDTLPEIVREALFHSGSYCLAVIPEASVDEVINADILTTHSTEEFIKTTDRVLSHLTAPRFLNTSKLPIKPLGANVTAQELAEHMVAKTMVNFTDNLGILHFSDVKEKISQHVMRRATRSGVLAQESADKLKYLDLFRERGTINNGSSNVHILKGRDETRRKSIGRPMVMRFPSSATIPVCVPGNEKEHIAYLVLLDGDGKPFNIDISNSRNDRTNLFVNNSNSSINATPIQIAYRNLMADDSGVVDAGQLYQMYKEILERQIFTSVKGSLYGSNFEIAAKNDIFFMMFSRALADEQTNILFVPKEQMTYFAFNYNEYGIGSSLLDNLSVLSSMRAILLFSSVMAQSKAAIDVTNVNVQLDPNDPDPEKTIAQIQEQALKLRQNFFPLGINNPVDLVDWIRRSGLKFNYTGNPLLPDLKIDFENSNTSHTVPNSDLEESLRKQTIQALGLSPEVIDSGFSPQFATTEINNNVLLAKRIALYQKTLAKLTSKFIGQIIYTDQELRSKLREVVAELKGDFEASLSTEEKSKYTQTPEDFLEDFLDKVSTMAQVELPRPENTNLAALAAEFDLYKQGLTNVIDSVITTEIFNEDLAGDITNHIDSIKSVYTHHLLRKWCADNNYFPEAMSLFSTSEEEVDTLIELITKHLKTSMVSSSKLLAVMKSYKKAAASDLKEILGDAAGESSFQSSPSSSSDSGGEGADEGGDSQSADDGLGGDLDLGGDDLTQF